MSDVGSVTSYLSKWLDVQFETLSKQHTKTFLRDEADLRSHLYKLNPLPKNALLFTSDATSMYTNICTKHAKEKLNNWIQTLMDNDTIFNNKNIPFPLTAVIEALDLIMNNETFDFGDTSWKQLTGVAMGTPAACQLATLYYGIHENETLLPKYNKNLLLFKRFIDDIFGIWIINNDTDLLEFENLKKDLPFGLLTWKTTDLSKTTDFLDLTITIDNEGHITTKTFQKKMNLYLYLPHHSAHPPGMLRSLLIGCLRRYWLQNSDFDDFTHISREFFTRLLDRGYDRPTLLQQYYKALQVVRETLPWKIRHTLEKEYLTERKRKETAPLSKEKSDKDLYFHWEYHPRGIDRSQIQDVYKKICNRTDTYTTTRNGISTTQTIKGFNEGIEDTTKNEHFKIRKLTVAYHIPKNLREHLNPSTLQLPTNMSVHTYLNTKT